MLRRRALAPAFCLLLLTACGGAQENSTGGDAAAAPSAAPSPSPPPGVDKAEYIRRAEGLCERADKDITRLSDTVPADPAEALNVLDVIVTRAFAAASDLRKLTNKQPDAAELSRIFIVPLDAQVGAARAYRDELRAALAKGPEALAAVPEPADPTPAPDLAAMRAYGFDACADLAEPSDPA